ncbi:DISP complex protein LRCH3-like isoform X2 [Artemia franciscana]|uniref:Calponin-homology (CH) domain-containing protein n=1 Tax=Artemia franciscana TaxID=6661 RepID=A0AA88LBA8_ARTSF|nr:hypothetical protein QYM36_005401 [Artemia franciscana]
MSAVKKTSDSTDKSTQKNLNRSVEKCLEEAQLSGVLKLSGRKLRDVAKLGTRSFDLTDVYKADLSKNRLFELPLELTECPSLETLNLYQNNIKSLPQEIIYLQSLTFLDLSRNQLSVLPPCLSQLPLQVLLVSHNKLVSLPEEFGRLASLLELDASCNEISHIPPQLGSLPKLHSLSLRRNLLVHIPLELTDLKLRKLDLGENRLEMLPVELRNMKQLEELRLDSNPLRSPPAYLCARGLVHVFKYLETQAAKEEREKNSSVIAPEPQRKLSQICDLRIFENCRSIRVPPSMNLSCNEKLQTEKEILDGDNLSNLSSNIADRSFKINGGSSRIPGAISPKEKMGISPNVSLPTSPVAADSPGAFESRIPGLRNGPSGNQKASPPSGNPPQTYRQYKESLKQQRENLYTRQKSIESPPVNGFPEQNPTPNSTGNVKPNLKESHSPAEIQPTPSFLHHVVTRVQPTHLINGTNHLPLDTGQKHSTFSTSELPVRTRLEPSSGPPRDVNDVPLRNPEKSSRPLSHGNQPPLPSANPPVHRLLPTPNRFPVKSGSRIPPPNPVSLVSYKSIDGNVQEQISALRQCIETRLKVSLPEDLGSALSDGVVLCHLANSVRPRSVSSIHVPSPAVPKLPLPKCKRNIENFIEACRKIGVEESRICSIEDILDRRDLPKISSTVTSLLVHHPRVLSHV